MSRGGEGEDPSVADRLAGEIADAIMVGEYPLGTWLRQEHLAERFGVSRQPVREALRRLEVVGMIEARPRRGLRVKGPEPGYIRDGYLIRGELEGLAAWLAAPVAAQSSWMTSARSGPRSGTASLRRSPTVPTTTRGPPGYATTTGFTS